GGVGSVCVCVCVCVCVLLSCLEGDSGVLSPLSFSLPLCKSQTLSRCHKHTHTHTHTPPPPQPSHAQPHNTPQSHTPPHDHSPTSPLHFPPSLFEGPKTLSRYQKHTPTPPPPPPPPKLSK